MISDDDGSEGAWGADLFRKYATLKEHYVENPHDIAFPGTFYDADDSFNIGKFNEELTIKVTRLEGLDCEFDISGAHPSLVNAFRRILLAEVPTMAIDKVFIENNTSIIQDEVLAHRLGLIPIKLDPRKFEFPQKTKPESDKIKQDPRSLDPLEALENEHVIFKLKLRCKKNPNAPPKSTDPDELYLDHKVYSGNLKWKAIGNQAELLQGEDAPKVVEDNILVAKLRPGHEIDLKVHCVKGVGKDHAKFSPVATATYRMLPEIRILKPVYGTLADKLASCFSDGVIEVTRREEDRVAKVVNARLDTGSREVLRHEELKDLVRLDKRKDYFLFSIESTGCLPPDILMIEAIKLMMGKCQTVLSAVKRAQKGEKGGNAGRDRKKN